MAQYEEDEGPLCKGCGQYINRFGGKPHRIQQIEVKLETGTIIFGYTCFEYNEEFKKLSSSERQLEKNRIRDGSPQGATGRQGTF